MSPLLVPAPPSWSLDPASHSDLFPPVLVAVSMVVMPMVLRSTHPHDRGSFIVGGPCVPWDHGPYVPTMPVLVSLFLKPVHLRDNDLSIPAGVVHALLTTVCAFPGP